jgi:aminoglycoside phosphotransferase (APT) family kinase protein
VRLMAATMPDLGDPAGMDRAVPDWVLETVGRVSAASRLRTGFTNESWIVTTADGQRLVATHMVDPVAAANMLDRAASVHARLAAAGIATPVPIPERSDRLRSVVTSPFVHGVPAMHLMADDAQAGLVGRIAGEAWLALGAVDPSGLLLDDLWARPSELTRAALSWLEPVASVLGRRAATQARARIAELPSLLAGRATGFVHGDLVPANVLTANGALVALLDLEAIRIGERLLDAAWFRWIVRHHHASREPSAWAGFVAASGLDPDDGITSLLIGILPTIRILEILAGRTLGPAARAGWIEHLQANVRAPSG